MYLTIPTKSRLYLILKGQNISKRDKIRKYLLLTAYHREFHHKEGKAGKIPKEFDSHGARTRANQKETPPNKQR
jgi:hypothetical protein